MVIRVSGYPGSGKTTLCKRLAEHLGYEYHYAGGIFRKMAEEKGMSIEDFYKNLASDPAVEKEVDQKHIELMEAKENLLIEGRVAPFLPCPHPTTNILLMVDADEGARRNVVRPENVGRGFEAVKKKTAERIATERAHYKELYGIDDHFDPKHFDIVVDSTHYSPEETFEAVRVRLPSC